MSHVVGIDLGTTNSLVAYVKNGVPEVIRGQSGDALVPSIVSIGDEGTIFVGREAQRRLLTAPARNQSGYSSVSVLFADANQVGEFWAARRDNWYFVTAYLATLGVVEVPRSE